MRPISTSISAIKSTRPSPPEGQYGNLFRLAAQFDSQATLFITAGKKATQFVRATRRQLVAEFDYKDTPRFEEARAIAAFARDLFLKREVDEVHVVATRFVNTLTQQPLAMEFLAFPPVARRGKTPELEVPRNFGTENTCCRSPSGRDITFDRFSDR